MHQTLLVIRSGQQESIHTEGLRDNALGNMRTLVFMRQFVREDAAFDLELRKETLARVASCKPNDFDCEVAKLFEMARRVRFIRDPLDVERIADAATTIRDGQGDCGDKTILLASMLGTIGYLSRFVIVNFYDDVATHGYDHVYLEVQRADGSWLPLDPTPENAPEGWEAAAPVRVVVDIWPNSGGDENISGILDSILPGLIQTGTQLAAGAYQQSQISNAQARQLAQQWDHLAGQTTALFNQIVNQPQVTTADLQRAVAAYQQLDAIAAQAGVQWITEQWNSSAYKPAYELGLQHIQARIVQPATTAAPGAVQSAPGATAAPGTVVGGATQPAETLLGGLSSSWLLPVVILGVVMVFVMRR